MSIIIISSDAREIEEMIARKIAEAMGWNLLGPEILIDIAAKRQIDPGKLREAMENTPSLFKSLSSRQWHHYLACLEADVLDRLLADNIVCWGLSAHLYVTGVSHAMEVRVLSSSSQGLTEIAEQKKSAFKKPKNAGRTS